MKKRFYDLTNPQMRIIYNDIMNPRLEMANVGYVVNMKGVVDPVKLEYAWNEVLKKNDGLRIQINNDHKLNQFFREYEYDKVEIITYLEISEIMNYIKGKYEEKFDIFNDQLVNFTCVHFNENESGFYIKFHHSVIDGIAAALVIEDIIKIYNDDTSSLACSNSYVDFIDYEKSYIDSKRYENNKNYWVEKYKNIDINTTICEIQKEDKFFTTKKQYVDIPKSQYNKILNFAKENNTTYFKLLSIAMGIYFERVKNESKILIGRAIHNRTKKDYRSIVGMFVSTVPLLIETDPEMTVEDTIRSVNTEMMSNMRHEKFPYNSLINLLRQDENSNVNSDFINILISENPPINSTNIEVVEQLFPKHSSYEMSIVLNPRNKLINNEMEIAIDFAEEILDKNQILNFIKRLHIIMENMIENPCIPVKGTEIISKEEKVKILLDFNDTNCEYQKKATIIQLFEQQVKKTPSNKAIIYEGGFLTYQELNDRANQLAWNLRNIGIGRNTIVPIITERSVEMMIGIYAILKAGGAYLPIDPKFPVDRVNYILENSNADFALLKTIYDNKINSDIKKIYLDKKESYTLNVDNLPNINESTDLCYIIYTSGSTGNPKGVMIQNYPLINRLNWMEKKYPLESTDVILQKTNFTFDVSVWELFRWGLRGASLCLLKVNGEKDPDEIIEVIYREKVTTLHFVPSMLSIFLENPDLISNIQKIKTLKNVFASGEALTKKHVERFFELGLPNTELNNLYGPTEATIDVTYYDCKKELNEVHIPIGKPIDNTKLLIVDKYEHIAPIGFPGELCILGDQLAKGYLNRPDLTEEKFVDTLFYNGLKMYKTGDLAKWRNDGNIDYLGRIDFQVKIRGFRIELGEIESRLSELEDIELVTVIDKENDKGDKYLAAYYTGEEYEVKKLRKKLSKSLPEYMIPSQFMYLSEMPLTISGKINRKELPEFNIKQEITNENLTGSIIEDEIIMIWKDVLERDDITRESDFFVLGGDSLDAIRVVGRLSKTFNISITDMFEQKTVAKLAEKIRGDKKSLIKSIESLKSLFYQYECPKEQSKVETLLKDEFHKYEDKMAEYVVSKNKKTEKEHKCVLLTGATGYLGAHLLYDLLKRTNSDIYVVVRGNSNEEALQRVNNKMKFYFEEKFDYQKSKDRLTILAGDISKDLLGLDNDSQKLITNVDCIINSAANVKHYGRYKDFHAVNVKGVENLIEIAKQNKNTDFYQISTKSVGAGVVPNEEYLVFSEDMVDVGQEINNFYIKTKLEAEKLCEKAREEGVNANILRVGNLVFNSKNGKFQENIHENAFYSKIKDMLATKVIPEAENHSVEFSFELSYIDFVSKAIVLLVSKGIMDNEIMHVYNPYNVSMKKLGEHLKKAGEDIELLPIDKYFEFLHEHHDNSELQVNVENILLNMMELSKSSKFTLRSCRSNEILKRIGLEWEEPKTQDIKKMLQYGKDIGFF